MKKCGGLTIALILVLVCGHGCQGSPQRCNKGNKVCQKLERDDPVFAGQRCQVPSDCTDEYNPYCSKWGQYIQRNGFYQIWFKAWLYTYRLLHFLQLFWRGRPRPVQGSGRGRDSRTVQDGQGLHSVGTHLQVSSRCELEVYIGISIVLISGKDGSTVLVLT